MMHNTTFFQLQVNLSSTTLIEDKSQKQEFSFNNKTLFVHKNVPPRYKMSLLDLIATKNTCF